MQIENDFFPLISGELGDSLQQTNQLQARLDQFVPIYQVFSLVTFENAQLSYWAANRALFQNCNHVHKFASANFNVHSK